MLHKLLDAHTCAECRFCCSFRRQSLWELPELTPDFAEKHVRDVNGDRIDYIFMEKNGVRYAVTDLTGRYVSDDENEEVKCPFLDENTGCVLSDDKPFDCMIWPLRVVRKPDGGTAIAIASTCPGMDKVPDEKILELLEEGLAGRIYECASEHPGMIKECTEEYRILDR
ncbi:MAG: hypothetical protein J6U50_08550 [Lachnospiraceae bacterium]|nr:hypothetical protein [Lachnospiraceae bacterium]